MIYKQKSTVESLSGVIKSFWMIDSEGDRSIRKEKVIPDGFPEMIFHYGDPFRAKITRDWQIQDKDLLAGQISNYFFLENTGQTGMFALKFQPWALRTHFGIKISDYTNKVLPLNTDAIPVLAAVKEIAISSKQFEDKIAVIEDLLTEQLNFTSAVSRGEQATHLMIQQNGAISLQNIYTQTGISERGLERYFKEYIGIPPKLYCRIIRFSHIFSLVNQGSVNWSDVSYHAGFYDQSHFIKNFKEFTGEEPSNYGFTKETMANFFLSK